MIRKFQQTDIDQVISIWLEASITAHVFIESAFWKSKVKDMREIYIPSGETYVFEEEEIIKGFVSMNNDTIAAIFVSPNYQGISIGTQLMTKSKEIREKLNLAVYTENHKSIEFYKKCGFKIEIEQIDEHTGHHEVLMVYPS